MFLGAAYKKEKAGVEIVNRRNKEKTEEEQNALSEELGIENESNKI